MVVARRIEDAVLTTCAGLLLWPQKHGYSKSIQEGNAQVPLQGMELTGEVLIGLGFLMSYQHMGIALVTCLEVRVLLTEKCLFKCSHCSIGQPHQMQTLYVNCQLMAFTHACNHACVHHLHCACERALWYLEWCNIVCML